MIDPDLSLSIVRNAKVICYDAETSGLDHTAFICGHVITELDGPSLYTPVRHQPGGNIPNPETFETALAVAFRDRQRRKLLTVGHNLEFDQRMTRRHGIILPAPLEDTMINEGLINDVAPGFSLEACAKRHGAPLKLGDDLYRKLAMLFGGVPDRKQMRNFWRLPGDDLDAVEYAIGDGYSTLGVWREQQHWLDECDLRRVHGLECELIPYLSRMRAIGLRIDMDKAQTIMKETDDAIVKALEPFPHGFNVNSGKEVEAFFRGIGFTEFVKTDTGKPSFLEGWLSKNEYGRQIVAVRQLRKSKDSFVTPLIDTHNVAGRVHPQLNQSKGDEYGAIGGRLSCSDPNLQAFPKRNKVVGKVVRQLVVPDEDKLIGEADFKQQEPRLYAHYSEDEKLLAGYTQIPNVDMHSIAMRYTGQDRDGAKRLGLGVLAGLGAASMGIRLGIPESDARELIQKFLGEAFPSIRTFQKDAKATMLARGYVKTILGRRATVLERHLAYKAVSRIIQGSGGDHMKLALLRANQFTESLEVNGWSPIDILMTIHDSNMFQFQRGRDDLKNELVRIVEAVAQEIGCMVPIPVDVGIGTNWAEASYGK